MASAPPPPPESPDGAGGFTEQAPAGVPSADGEEDSIPGRADPVDIDNDKDLDVVVALAGAGQLVVLRGAGDGVLVLDRVANPADRQDVGVEPRDLAVGFLDDDAFIDVASAHQGDGTVSVLVNDGAGSLIPAVNLPVGDSSLSLKAFAPHPRNLCTNRTAIIQPPTPLGVRG